MKTLPVATVRTAVLGPLIRHLDEKHHRTDALLAEHGFVRSLLDDPYGVVPLARYVALFEAAATALKDPGLGLRLGRLIRPADLGPLGLLFSAAPTLRSAFTRLAEFVAALQGATRVGLQRYENFSSWTYQIDDAQIWPRTQDTEFSLAVACQLARSSAGSGWHPIEIHLEHARSADKGAFERFFRAPVRFRQSANRMLMDDADADRLIRTEDRSLTQILERHIRDLAAEHAGDPSIAQRVHRMIGLNLGQKRITVEQLALSLGLSSRTLQRHLEEEGTSVRALVQKRRREMAELHIGSTQVSQAEIAHALGYSDGTVFWRAFRSWTGSTPSAFRRRSRRSS